MGKAAVLIQTKTDYPFEFFLPEMDTVEELLTLVDECYEEAVFCSDDATNLPTLKEIANVAFSFKYFDVLIQKSLLHDAVYLGASSIREDVLEHMRAGTMEDYRMEMLEINDRSGGPDFNEGWGEDLCEDIKTLLSMRQYAYLDVRDVTTEEILDDLATSEVGHESYQEYIKNSPVVEVW